VHIISASYVHIKAAGMAARVKEEVEIHSRLKHPSILEVGGHDTKK
jgi:hypothetical protein